MILMMLENFGGVPRLEGKNFLPPLCYSSLGGIIRTLYA